MLFPSPCLRLFALQLVFFTSHSAGQADCGRKSAGQSGWFLVEKRAGPGYQGPSRSQGNVERGVNLCMISTAINPVAVGFFECDSFAKNMLKMEFGRLTVVCCPHFFAAT